MARSSKINRTNAPRTCLWCGAALRRQYTTEERTISRVEYETLLQLRDRGTRRGFNYDGHRVTWMRGNRHADGSGTIAISIPTDEYGKDGLFHSGTCAQEFGFAAARAGFRFKPYKED